MSRNHSVTSDKRFSGKSTDKQGTAREGCQCSGVFIYAEEFAVCQRSYFSCYLEGNIDRLQMGHHKISKLVKKLFFPSVHLFQGECFTILYPQAQCHM